MNETNSRERKKTRRTTRWLRCLLLLLLLEQYILLPYSPSKSFGSKCLASPPPPNISLYSVALSSRRSCCSTRFKARFRCCKLPFSRGTPAAIIKSLRNRVWPAYLPMYDSKSIAIYVLNRVSYRIVSLFSYRTVLLIWNNLSPLLHLVVLVFLAHATNKSGRYLFNSSIRPTREWPFRYTVTPVIVIATKWHQEASSLLWWWRC